MSKYQPGDKVRIVSDMENARGRNSEGGMDHWAGKVMTVKKYYLHMTFGDTYEMEEDSGLWAWYSDTMIAGLAEPEINIEKNDLMSFLNGKGV